MRFQLFSHHFSANDDATPGTVIGERICLAELQGSFPAASYGTS
jgi:hypothetical protein